MIVSILKLLSAVAFASEAQPTTFPVFLKQGFSTILEFQDLPTKVVIGDSKNFQIERVEKSILIKPLIEDGSSNLFIYFKREAPRLLLLRVSEDAEPLLYKRFENVIVPKTIVPSKSVQPPKTKVLSTTFSKKKDYLVVDVLLVAQSDSLIQPKWEMTEIVSKNQKFRPTKVWSERKDIQRNTGVRSRFVFYRPNIPLNLRGTLISIPLVGGPAINLDIGRP